MARCGTVVLMDADRDYGPAGDLAPDSRRSSKTLSDLLADFDEAPHPPQLRPYMSTLDDGLLILQAPSTRAEMRALTPVLVTLSSTRPFSTARKTAFERCWRRIDVSPWYQT